MNLWGMHPSVFTPLKQQFNAFLQEHDPYTSSVMTLEDEIHFDVEGVDHNVLEAGTPPAKYHEKLGSILRSDPDTMLIGRLIDAESAKMLARSADDIRFYLPLPAEDTFAGLRMWVKAVGERKLAAEALAGVLAQRLVRKLCTNCRQPYKPDPAALKKLNLPAEKVGTLYKAAGKITDDKGREHTCPACHGMGYRGRVAVFEVDVGLPLGRFFDQKRAVVGHERRDIHLPIGLHVDQAHRRHDDDRGQRRHGQVLEQRGQDEERQADDRLRHAHGAQKSNILAPVEASRCQAQAVPKSKRERETT